MDRPVGPPVEVKQALPPPTTPITGHSVQLEPLTPNHIDDLYPIIGQPEQATLWTYLPKGAFADKTSFAEAITSFSTSKDPFFYAIINKTTKKPIGFFSLLRIDLTNRVIEIGFVVFSSLLQRTAAATEAVYLLAKTVFEDLGYRRFEWKCDNLNAPSKKAAVRFGFTAEGVFRQHLIVKGRNRDTAWFSILDCEWPVVKGAFEKWLDPGNFDADGKQVASLVELRGV
jgi:RimJ/RimL family protein N-acetyltransferase